jgi:hypothetical protein
MQTSNAASEQNQPYDEIAREQQAAHHQRQLLTPFKAKRIKRALIERYCREQLSEAAVSQVFSTFPELKGA